MIDPFNAAADKAEIELAGRLQEVLRGEPSLLCLRAIARVIAERDRPRGYELGDMLEIVSQRARLYTVIGSRVRSEVE